MKSMKRKIKSQIKKLADKNKFFIILNQLRKKIKIKRQIRLIRSTERHYQEVIAQLKNRRTRALRFAAYVIYGSTYGGDGLFQLMMEHSDQWKPKIVVIPDVYRGKKHQNETYCQTKKFFIEKYGDEYVVDGYNIETGEIIDVSDSFDVVYCANPYDTIVDPKHSICYLSKKNLLVFHLSYGFDVGFSTTLGRMTNLDCNLLWKYFTDTTYSYNDFVKYQLNKGRNVELVGYAKMDVLSKYKYVSKKKRKKILIAVHHTVAMEELPLSNFLEYYDLIPELSEMFPDIDFIFRPHPLLFTAMINNNFWTEKQVDEYLQKLQEHGIIYSTSGDYMQLYAECDALINDCGSFTVEWLYTGKPSCFAYSKKLNENMLTTLMLESIKCQYVAHSREDIISFVNQIVNDEYKKTLDEVWLKENIMVNYPNVSKVIFDKLNSELLPAE